MVFIGRLQRSDCKVLHVDSDSADGVYSPEAEGNRCRYTKDWYRNQRSVQAKKDSGEHACVALVINRSIVQREVVPTRRRAKPTYSWLSFEMAGSNGLPAAAFQTSCRDMGGQC
jgi:hypothetical protein